MPLFSKKPQIRTPKIDSGKRAPVTTYYRTEKQPQVNSPFKKKQTKKNRRKYLFGFLDIVLILLLLFGLGYSLGLNSRPKVIANDTSFHPAATYNTAVDARFASLINRNKLTFDEQGIIKSLQKLFPEISSASVELPFFSEQATMRLSISKPSFMLNSQGANYIVNSSGVVVAKAQQLPNIKNLMLVNDQSGFKAALGKQVLSAEQTNFINTLIAQCKYSKIPISSLTLPAIAQELDLRTTDQPYYVKFYLGGDVLNEAGQFVAARNHFIQTKQSLAQYLDVRVAGKIFYM